MKKNREGLSARQAALKALTRVEADDAFVNLALSEAICAKQMDPRDIGLATEITYGVISYRLTLDWLIAQAARRPAEKLDPLIRRILRIGFYQLFYLDRIPAPAAVHTTVELVKAGKKRGLASFVNGVMRGALRSKDKLPWPKKEEDVVAYLTLKYSHPDWLVKRWLGRFGAQETEELLAANNRPAPVSVRVNTLKTDRDKLLESLCGAGLEAETGDVVSEHVIVKGGGRLTGLDVYRQGHFQMQGESAMLTSHILSPQPGMRVLDGCSAPGGKTTHLAALMDNRGEIIALDIHPHRLELVEANCRRLGIGIVKTMCLDAQEADGDKLGSFDRILLDVPCSGFGVIRRKPDLKWRRKEEDIRELANVQQKMITACSALLKPGGALVYSTCTNEPEETWDVVNALLDGNGSMASDDIRPFLPQDWRVDAKDRGIQLYPHVHGVDGFFISRLKKIET
jgi:16S rRNA (cytosine967-C5)-methyltransferase